MAKRTKAAVKQAKEGIVFNLFYLTCCIYNCNLEEEKHYFAEALAAGEEKEYHSKKRRFAIVSENDFLKKFEAEIKKAIEIDPALFGVDARDIAIKGVRAMRANEPVADLHMEVLGLTK